MLTTGLFDLDGTLIEPHLPFFFAEARRLFASYGMPDISDEAMLSAHSRGTFFDFFPYDERDEYITQFWLDFRSSNVPSPQLLPGVLETLSELRSMGLTMAIITARSITVDELVQSFGALRLEEYFDLILTLGPTAPTERSKKRIAAEALTKLNRRPDETFIIGDSDMDIVTGRASGLAKVIAVLTGGLASDYLESFKPDHILSHVGELPSLLRECTDKFNIHH